MELTIEVQSSNELQLILQYIRLLPTAKVLVGPKNKPKKAPSSEEPSFRQFGFAKDFITYIAPDFDDTPPGFEEYMLPAAP